MSRLRRCLDSRDRTLVSAVAGDERLDHREPLVGADVDLGVPERGALLEPLDEARDGSAKRRRGHIPVDHDDRRVDRADAELLLEGEKAFLRGDAVGEGAQPGPREPKVEDRRRRCQEQRRRGDEADHRPPHHGAGDPRPETAFPACRVDRPAEEGDAERVDPIAEDAQQRRRESERRQHRDECNGDRADAEGAQHGVGDKQQA